MTSNRVNLINENDAGSILLPLLKQITHTRSAHANKHFYEVRPRDREKGNIRLASHCTGEQGLAGSRRSDQQHTFGNASTKLLEFLCLAQELNDFAQLFLGFVDAG